MGFIRIVKLDRDKVRELHLGTGETTQQYLWELHQHYNMPKGEVIKLILNDFLSNKSIQDDFQRFHHESLDSSTSETSGKSISESFSQATYLIPTDLFNKIANLHQKYKMRSRNSFLRILINYYYILNLGKEYQDVNLELFNQLKGLGFNVTDRKVFEGEHWVRFCHPPNDKK